MTKQLQIGNTDLYVNPIGLGANTIGAHNLYPNTNDDEGRALVEAHHQYWYRLFRHSI